MKIYSINCVLGDDGDLKGNTLSPCDLFAMTDYGDGLREHGAQNSQQFPSDWRWLSSANEPHFDYPPMIDFGCVLSYRSFVRAIEVFGKLCALRHDIAIDGERYVWFDVKTYTKDAIATALKSGSPLFLLKPGYKLHCSSEFRDFWIKNGFTGIDFREWQ